MNNPANIAQSELSTKQPAALGTIGFPDDGYKHRAEVRGKFLFIGEKKFYVRGVTYGTFRPEPDGCDYHHPERVDHDFALMAANGLNSVRTYTVPPLWLLDLARKNGLRVMVGLPWEQHIAFLSDKKRMDSIEQRVRDGVKACARHPAVLCYAIGNEIPANISRWHGRKKMESFLKRLYRAAKETDPEGLVTYVNFPSTEYLRLPFVDLLCFNVYLESQKTLDAYLARLHNLAGDQPVLMAEIGLDSRRNGEAVQARVLDWQVRTAMAAGCCGAFVFAWTDEWHRGGFDIDDWDFGLVTRDRQPKPALAAVRDAFSETPFPQNREWPRVSVVVCTYNGARTLRNCLQGLSMLDYPNFEVIVVIDGSTDHSKQIADEFNVRVIVTENRGLSSARNTGMTAANGEIVAYIDDDAYPDSHWLTYLATTFMTTSHAGVGGPNIAPPGDGPVADCVVNAPGGPAHVLLMDLLAEHIPGCNMAFRKSCIEAINGFDTSFRVAGDDVDFCWRIQEQGWTIGFNPAAMVWHHRRNCLRNYWRQQQGYGRAEAMLERKWPEKYNAVGHIKWSGRLYGRGFTRLLARMGRIYHGSWGSAPFQIIHDRPPRLLSVLPTMPEWYLVLLMLAAVSAMGFLWPKLFCALPLLVFAICVSVAQAAWSAAHSVYPAVARTRASLWKRYFLTACLHLIQPMARLSGRLRYGLTMWRWHIPIHGINVLPREMTMWSEKWKSPEDQLRQLDQALGDEGAVVRHGNHYARWDLEVRAGSFGRARLLMAVEEHGGGKQLFRLRVWPKWPRPGLIAIAIVGLLAFGAVLDREYLVAGMFGLITAAMIFRALRESSSAIAVVKRVVDGGCQEME
jgi:glycosyltransferase involved in cell wall biosynthesis